MLLLFGNVITNERRDACDAMRGWLRLRESFESFWSLIHEFGTFGEFSEEGLRKFCLEFGLGVWYFWRIFLKD